MKGCSLEERFWAKVNKDGPIVREELGPCWEWTVTLSSTGYGQIRIGPRIGGRLFLAHRVAYALEHGMAPSDIALHVCHRCDNPKCVRPSHLFLGTAADNMADMVAKGRYSDRPRLRGEAHPMARLTEDKVRAIRNSTGDQREAAKAFGCSQGTVHLIRKGKIWRHVS